MLIFGAKCQIARFARNLVWPRKGCVMNINNFAFNKILLIYRSKLRNQLLRQRMVILAAALITRSHQNHPKPMRIATKPMVKQHIPVLIPREIQPNRISLGILKKNNNHRHNQMMTWKKAS